MVGKFVTFWSRYTHHFVVYMMMHRCLFQVSMVLSSFFQILCPGSQGKLTMVTQRIGVLSGIGNMSYNTVAGGSTIQDLAGVVAELFIPFLQQEGKH